MSSNPPSPSFLIFGTTPQQQGLYNAVKAEGFEAIGVDASGESHIDGFNGLVLEANPSDINDCITQVDEYIDANRLIGISTLGTFAADTVSQLAYHLHKPCFSAEAARRLRSLITSYTLWGKSEIPLPWYRALDNIHELYLILQQRAANEQFTFSAANDPFGYSSFALQQDAANSEKPLPSLPGGKLGGGHWIVKPMRNETHLYAETVFIQKQCVTTALAVATYEQVEQQDIVIQRLHSVAMPVKLSPALFESLNRLIFDAGLALGVDNGIVTSSLSYNAEKKSFFLHAMKPFCPLGKAWADAIEHATGLNIYNVLVKQAIKAPMVIKDFLPQYLSSSVVLYVYDNTLNDSQISQLKAQPFVVDVHMMSDAELAMHVSPLSLMAPVGWVVISDKQASQIPAHIETVTRFLTQAQQIS